MWDVGKVLETDAEDGCTTMCVYIRWLHSIMLQNFMFCIFYNILKKGLA